MNVKRRKSIESVLSRMETLLEELEQLKDEEQEYVDNIPENLQGTERYENAETAISSMDDVIENTRGDVETLRESITL